MTTQATPGALRALAELVHQIRPDWNRAGIQTALSDRIRPIDEHIRAAVDAALDPTARTPAVIATRDGAAWTPSGVLEQRQPTATPRPYVHPVPTLTPEAYADRVAKARDVLHQARAGGGEEAAA